MAIIKDGSRNVELTGEDKLEYIKKRFPKYYYEEIVTSKEQELIMRIEWLEKGLKEMYKSTTIKNIQDTITSILDGEPTTADRYNEE